MHLVAPCSDCPFLREGGIRLRRRRALDIATMMLEEGAGGSFACHQSVGVGCSRRPARLHNHCAGALIFAEKHQRQTVVMQIAGRLGFYDPAKLRGHGLIFDSVNEMLSVQFPEVPSMPEPKPPEHAAAYAAALYHAGVAKQWKRLADVLDAAGLGRYPAAALRSAALAWAKRNVAPAAVTFIRKRFRERAPPP